MIIAEYTLDHPILRETFQCVPGMELTVEDTYVGSNGQKNVLAWIECEDFEILDAAIADDPTVVKPTVFTEIDDRRLYRFDLAGEGDETSIIPVLIEVGGVELETIATSDGWRNRTRYPSREAFEQVYRFCLDHDIGFELHRIYESSPLFRPDTPSLSEAQRETLIEAVASGYLEIPRSSSLKELADRIGISESATSERFRRGVKTLIEQTIYPDDE